MVVPSGKNEPEAGAHVIAGALSKLSLAVTSKSTTAPGRLRSALSSSLTPAVTSTSSTGATTGAVQSATNAADVSPRFPSASWAVTVSVCAPSAGGVNWKLASHATGAPSTAHVNVPGSLSATVAVAVWSAPLPGVIEIVAVGALVSTVNPVFAGGETLSITSRAVIATVCGPSARPVGENGDVQAAAAPPSTVHAKVASASSDVNATCGARVGETGGVIVTTGGVRFCGCRSSPSVNEVVAERSQFWPECSHAPSVALSAEQNSHEAGTSGVSSTT